MNVFNDLKLAVEKNLSSEVEGLTKHIAHLLKDACESKPDRLSPPEVAGKKIVTGSTSLDRRLMKSMGLVEIVNVIDFYSKAQGQSFEVVTDKGKETYQTLLKEGYFRR